MRAKQSIFRLTVAGGLMMFGSKGVRAEQIDPATVDPSYLVDLTLPTSQQPVGTVAEGPGGHTSYKVGNAFDGSVLDAGRWLPAAARTGNAWMTYLFSAPTRVNAVRICSGRNTPGRYPKAFTFEGSNDGGSTWSLLDNETGLPGWGTAEWRLYAFPNAAAYAMYRLTFTENQSANADYTEICEIECFYIPASQNMLVIAGTPGPLGEVAPGYGTLDNLPVGTSIVCTADGPYVAGGVRYALAGCVIEALDADGNGFGPVTNLAVSTYTYTHQAGAPHRLTWLWEPDGYALAADPLEGLETVLSDPSPDAGGFYAPGTVVTLTACPHLSAPASAFLRWEGADVPAGHETDNPLALTMDAPKTIRPRFTRHWVLDSDTTPNTIGDGNWLLKITPDGSGWRLGTTGGAISNAWRSGSGDLDLTGVAADCGVSLTSVAQSAFAYVVSLASVRLPPSVETVGLTAFQNSSCTNAVLSGVRFIQSKAFFNLPLISVTLSDAVTNIASEAFAKNAGGEALPMRVTPWLPDSLGTLGVRAFLRCNVGAPLVLGNPALDTVGDYTFAYTGIPDLSLPHVATIGPSAFLSCGALTNAVAPNAVALKNGCFNGCDRLARVRVSDRLERIEDYAFLKNDTADRAQDMAFEPFLPSTLTFLGQAAFVRCDIRRPLNLASPAITSVPLSCFQQSGITALSLPETLTSLSVNAFQSCTNLQSVQLPAGLESIGQAAFLTCTALKDVRPFLPASVTNVGYQAFVNCPVTNALSLTGKPFVTLGTEAFRGVQMASIGLGKGVTNLPSKVFSGCTFAGQVWFSGEVPGFTGNTFEGWGNLQARFYVSKRSAAWAAYAAANVTPLTDAQKTAFAAAYPNEPLAVGTFVAPGMSSFWREWFCTWVTAEDARAGTVIYLQ